MPFTLSHPAAAVAFWPAIRRGYLPLDAFVIGSMSPDFEFFLHLRPVALWSHTLLGWFLFCLPAGLLVLGAWELVVRRPTRHLLALDAEPAPPPSSPGIRWWLAGSVAVFLGAGTHLLWDGLTHEGYWGAELMPALRGPAVSIFGHTVPWFNLLQHASTVAGGLVVLGWLVRELRRAGAQGVIAHSWRWLVLVTLAAVALIAGVLNGLSAGVPTNYWTGRVWLGRAAVGGLLALGTGLLVYGVAWQLFDRRENTREAA